MARPTDYKPEYCDQVIEWGRMGKSLTWMASQLDISRDTIYDWVKTKPEFSDAISRAKAHAQAHWEDLGEVGLSTQGFNASVYTKSMAARFPEDWRDNKAVELTGANGGPIESKSTVSVSPDEAYKRMLGG
jgi:hypothetical protein